MPYPSYTVTFDVSQLGQRERALARMMPSVIDPMLREMSRRAASLLQGDAIVRRIRRTGAYIRGWRSTRIGPRRYQATSHVAHAKYVESYHGVVTAPHNQDRLRRMVHEVAERHIDAAIRRAFRGGR